jgi:anionic cell wall polymer biosynthesis LytR-Cps2A-Psr (LCP) family protein
MVSGDFDAGDANEQPDASLNITTLFMLSETKGGFPDCFMLVNYIPRNNAITIVPLNPKTILSGSTVSEVYRKGAGASGVIRAIETELKIPCKHYVKFDKQSFIEFANSFGSTSVTLPEEAKYGNEVFPSGKQILSGDRLYTLLTLPGMSEDKRETVQGSAIASLINRNFQKLDVTDIQNLFEEIIKDTDTDMTMEDYTENQRAYLYTTLYGADIADYSLLYGTSTNAGFTVSPESAESVRDRFNLNT